MQMCSVFEVRAIASEGLIVEKNNDLRFFRNPFLSPLTLPSHGPLSLSATLCFP